jgi:hypothetical protein
MGDAITATVMVFCLALIILVGVYLTTQLKNTGNATIDAYTGLSYNAVFGLDSLAPFFVIAICVGLIFSSMMINSNPIFFFAMLFVNFAYIIVSIGLSNAWNSSIAGSALVPAASSMVNFSALMTYLPVIAIVISIIFAIALFFKGGQGGG